MSKVVPAKDLGVPVPTPAVDPTLHLVAYYGPKGFTPSYSQAQRTDLGAVSTLAVTTANNVSYWDVPLAKVLGPTAANGTFDVAFTLADASGNEGDFSPAVTETVDISVPPKLGQPILLG